MAKKSNTKQATDTTGFFTSLKYFFTNERTRFISGLVISFVTVYVGLSLISFFFTGGIDQSKIDNVPLGDLVINKGSVANWTGVRGAYLADLLMNRWFGISSFVILFFLGSLGAKLMNLNNVSLLRRFIFSSTLLIWGSLFFAFVFIKGYEDTFIYLGGQHGYYLSEKMTNNIGLPGTFLFILGTFIIIAVFSSKRTIPFLQNLLSFSWLKKRFANKEKAFDESVEEESGELIAEFDTEKELAEAEVVKEKPVRSTYADAIEEDSFEINIPQEEEPYEDFPEIASAADVPGDVIFTVDVPVGDDEVFDGSSMGEYDPKLDLSQFRYPTTDLLKKYDVGDHQVDMEEQKANQTRIKQTLENFGINIASIKATVGPTLTLYEVIPEAGVRISK
ncbi:MAG: DNA translocase FtsK 4TM domain-containing protein, partial [Tannerellaceae bacterium]|nr:DNA translocase FtsK 4TM domain-containing protein [Tannerellaceae bacterium]